DIHIDDAGNVCERGKEVLEPERVPIINSGQKASPTTAALSWEKPSHSQLKLETPRTIAGVNVTRSQLVNALYQFIPASGEIPREDLIDKTSRSIGVSVEAALAELNKLINEERSYGRLHVTPGSWENVWRA